MKILEIHMRIMKIIKILEVHVRNIKIMKIIEILLRIMKSNEIRTYKSIRELRKS